MKCGLQLKDMEKKKHEHKIIKGEKHTHTQDI